MTIKKISNFTVSICFLTAFLGSNFSFADGNVDLQVCSGIMHDYVIGRITRSTNNEEKAEIFKSLKAENARDINLIAYNHNRHKKDLEFKKMNQQALLDGIKKLEIALNKLNHDFEVDSKKFKNNRQILEDDLALNFSEQMNFINSFDANKKQDTEKRKNKPNREAEIIENINQLYDQEKISNINFNMKKTRVLEGISDKREELLKINKSISEYQKFNTLNLVRAIEDKIQNRTAAVISRYTKGNIINFIRYGFDNSTLENQAKYCAKEILKNPLAKRQGSELLSYLPNSPSTSLASPDSSVCSSSPTIGAGGISGLLSKLFISPSK